MPQTRRASGAPTSTPPEHLSARGDRPGGYFPFHDDPQTRVHRTHQFAPDSGVKINRVEHDGTPLNPNLVKAAANGSIASCNTTPVASYIPSGVHDTLLPMGKYYPSNYEKRSQQNSRPDAPVTATAKSDSHVPMCISSTAHRQLSPSWNDSDVKKKLQQYQRDMITQASLAMGTAAKNNKCLLPPSEIKMNSAPLRTHTFTAGTPAKPISPRLAPLGSPGPVTPMELESSRSEGSYLDKGRGTLAHDADKKTRQNHLRVEMATQGDMRQRDEMQS